MRTTNTAAIAATCVALVGCGGQSSSSGATCGQGTMLVDGQCVVSGVSGGGQGGAGGTGGIGGQDEGNGGSSAGSASVSLDGGGDASAPDFCLGKDVVAKGDLGLLDDFEDHNVGILANDGRLGPWFWGGANCTLGPIPLAPQPPVAGIASSNASKYAMRVTATGCTQATLGVGFNENNTLKCGYDASAYDGVYFWGIGAGTHVVIGIGLRTTLPLHFGGDGSCAQDSMDKGCWDRHSFTVDLTGDWKQYSFTWAQLQQAGWGTRKPWDAKLTGDIAFVVGTTPGPPITADFSIDNVGFFKGTPPIDPPMPGL